MSVPLISTKDKIHKQGYLKVGFEASRVVKDSGKLEGGRVADGGKESKGLRWRKKIKKDDRRGRKRREEEGRREVVR